MQGLELLFWCCAGILFFCYIGYGGLVWCWKQTHHYFAPRRETLLADLPPVTIIVCAFNERSVLHEKIINTLAIDYPQHLLEIIFVTDGSSDGSDELVRAYPGIRLLHQPERRGKMAAICRAMQRVETPITVFTDANTLLNPGCLKAMVRHYADPRTGGVAGEKKIMNTGDAAGVGEGEGLYWRYESFLKECDSALYTVVGAAGELFSLRTLLFREPAQSIVLDDFWLSIQVCLQGYRIAYEKNAYATELPSLTIAEEEKRKVRIGAGAYQSIPILLSRSEVWKQPLFLFQYVIRRLLRWTLCPLLVVALLPMNFLLVSSAGQPDHFYTFLFVAQLLFYLVAFVAGVRTVQERRNGWLSVPFYFVFMNYCLLAGMLRWLRNEQSAVWEKSIRQTASRYEPGLPS